MASFLIVLNKDAEATKMLQCLLQVIDGNDMEYSLEFYKETGKRLMEVELYDESARMIDKVIKMDDTLAGIMLSRKLVSAGVQLF